MNKFTQLAGSFLLSLITLNVSSQNIDTLDISMGPGYAQDIFLNVTTGQSIPAPRNNYDLQIYTGRWSAGLLSNDGQGVMVWAYPKGDTATWNAVDTTGLSTWKALYNGLDSWENGAFNRNAKGHPDYGWGVYNTVTHDVEGDSLFVIKTRNNLYKKLWITRKISVENKWLITVANLDGSNKVNITADCNLYPNKAFLGIDLETASVIDREPDSSNYELLFTKYISNVQGMPYPVVGVLSNITTPGNKFSPVAPDFTNWLSSPMVIQKELIGYDWKNFNMSTFSYDLADSTFYFIKSGNGDIYKLWFTKFEGSSTGNIRMARLKVSATAIDDPEISSNINIYPNPATNVVNIQPDANGILRIYNLNGIEIINKQFTPGETLSLNIENLNKGIYLLRFSTKTSDKTKKLIIQ